ncbi:macrophage scavenger receptor types I and II-like [Homarus americanus]|uniref:macrophage scavenger receptor types I and II-like n=1 Tax=Homarus americanus TaxID=6706 RepID=UPI001C442B1C|nr:macrophage scavenger receptor types I and II-like [Homarus americanus]
MARDHGTTLYLLRVISLLVLLLPSSTPQELQQAGTAGTHKINRVHLTDGRAPHEGNIEVEVDGVWGFVCDDGFGFVEADVVCRDLGYERAETFTRNNYFGNNSPGV